MFLAIVACVANENKYINEWISYHIRLGFDHLYIYCNEENPESLYKTILPWINMGLVTFNHHPVLGDQRGMYLHYLHTYKSREEWVSFLDIDEFFSIRECLSIKDFVAARQDLDCIYFNWLRFGTNFHKINPDGLVLDNYIHREKVIVPTFKIIVKTKCLNLQFMCDNHSTFHHGLGVGSWFFSPFNGSEDFKGQNVIGHSSKEAWDGQYEYTNKFSEQIIWTATVAHYYLRSEEHYKERSLRGKKLGPGWELEWTQRYESGAYKKEIEETNAFHDTWLSNRDKELHLDLSVFLRKS